MAKLVKFFSSILFLVCLCSLWQGAYADGVGDFLEELCNEYPAWLAANYPDPSPALSIPINVSVETDPASETTPYYLNASFTNYQLFDHSRPDTWEFANMFVDLSSGTIDIRFHLKLTKFGGRYTAEGMYNGDPVTGNGGWSLRTAYPGYISFNLNYFGAQVTEDLYVDLKAGTMESVFYYVPLAGIPNVREIDGLTGAGQAQILLVNKIFNALEWETHYMIEHPLPSPLNDYLQAAFSSTPIPEMGKWVEEKRAQRKLRNH